MAKNSIFKLFLLMARSVTCYAIMAPVCVNAADLVIWHSQPVKPGQTVLIYGEKLHGARVELQRLDDAASGMPGTGAVTATSTGTGRTLDLIQPREHAVKAVLPVDTEPGVFALRVQSDGREQAVLVNAPQVWWARGDSNLDAFPGGEVRVFGLCLGWKGAREPLAGTPSTKTSTRVVLRGPAVLELAVAEADLYAAQARLSQDAPPGDYEVWVHNGCGGAAAWGRCSQRLKVRQPQPWPVREFNVLRFGARGDGAADDTAAVQSALDAAARNGGGIVRFPSGQYRFNRTLTVPQRVFTPQCAP